jgi:transposase
MWQTNGSSMPQVYASVSGADKLRLIQAHENDEDYHEVARVLGIKRTTAWAIIRRHQQTGAVERPRGGARNEVRKVDDEMKEAMVNIVERHSAYTLKQIKEQLQRLLPQKPIISVSTVAKTLDGALIRIKKLEDMPQDRNSDRIKDLRRDYANWMMTQGVGHNLFYLDETGFNLFTRRTRGRARVGQRAVRQVGNSKGRHLTVIMTISPDSGLFYFDLMFGGLTADILSGYLDNVRR